MVTARGGRRGVEIGVAASERESDLMFSTRVGGLPWSALPVSSMLAGVPVALEARSDSAVFLPTKRFRGCRGELSVSGARSCIFGS